MKKLLFISELGNKVSYSYVTLSLKKIIEENYDVYYFCIRNINDKKLIIENNYNMNKVYFIDKNLQINTNLKNKFLDDYYEDWSDGLIQLECLIKNINPNIIMSFGDLQLVSKHGKLINNLKFFNGYFVPYITLDCYNCHYKMLNYNFDLMFTVSEFSKKQVSKYINNTNIHSLPHYLNEKEYFKLNLSKNEKNNLKRKILGNEYNNYFILGTINCNSFRKKIDICIESFCNFASKNNNTLLVIKSQLINKNIENPIYGGYNINSLIKDFCSKYQVNKDRIIVIDDFYDSKKLNELYNIFDVFITTTSGEGWGLTNIEAALCQLPIIMPNITSMTEIFGNNYDGYFNTQPYTISFCRNPNYLDINSNSLKNLYYSLSINYKYYEKIDILFLDDEFIDIINIPTFIISDEKVKIEHLKIIGYFETYHNLLKYLENNNNVPIVYQVLMKISVPIIKECVDTLKNNIYFKTKKLYKIKHLSIKILSQSVDIDNICYSYIGNYTDITNKINLYYNDKEKIKKNGIYLYNQVKNKYTFNYIKSIFNKNMSLLK